MNERDCFVRKETTWPQMRDGVVPIAIVAYMPKWALDRSLRGRLRRLRGLGRRWKYRKLIRSIRERSK